MTIDVFFLPRADLRKQRRRDSTFDKCGSTFRSRGGRIVPMARALPIQRPKPESRGNRGAGKPRLGGESPGRAYTFLHSLLNCGHLLTRFRSALHWPHWLHRPRWLAWPHWLAAPMAGLAPLAALATLPRGTLAGLAPLAALATSPRGTLAALAPLAALATLAISSKKLVGPPPWVKRRNRSPPPIPFRPATAGREMPGGIGQGLRPRSVAASVRAPRPGAGL